MKPYRQSLCRSHRLPARAHRSLADNVQRDLPQSWILFPSLEYQVEPFAVRIQQADEGDFGTGGRGDRPKVFLAGKIVDHRRPSHQ